LDIRYKNYYVCDCKGGALVEFALLLGVLLPIGLGMSMLGKLTDLKQTSEQASRYSTWEATVYSRSALSGQPSTRLQQRFFETPEDAIRSQVVSNDEQDDGANPLWGHENVSDSALRDQASVARDVDTQVSANYRFDTGKAKAAHVSGELVSVAGKLLEGFSGNSWGIEADGLLRSDIDVALQSRGFLSSMQGACQPKADNSSEERIVCMQSAGVILADGWGASSDKHAVRRSRSLVPSCALTQVGEAVGGLLGSTIFPELESLEDALGHVDMNVLPEYAKP